MNERLIEHFQTNIEKWLWNIPKSPGGADSRF